MLYFIFFTDENPQIESLSHLETISFTSIRSRVELILKVIESNITNSDFCGTASDELATLFQDSSMKWSLNQLHPFYRNPFFCWCSSHCWIDWESDWNTLHKGWCLWDCFWCIGTVIPRIKHEIDPNQFHFFSQKSVHLLMVLTLLDCLWEWLKHTSQRMLFVRMLLVHCTCYSKNQAWNVNSTNFISFHRNLFICWWQ